MVAPARSVDGAHVIHDVSDVDAGVSERGAALRGEVAQVQSRGAWTNATGPERPFVDYERAAVNVLIGATASD